MAILKLFEHRSVCCTLRIWLVSKNGEWSRVRLTTYTSRRSVLKKWAILPTVSKSQMHYDLEI